MNASLLLSMLLRRLTARLSSRPALAALQLRAPAGAGDSERGRQNQEQTPVGAGQEQPWALAELSQSLPHLPRRARRR